jgi:hypothetical protein
VERCDIVNVNNMLLAFALLTVSAVSFAENEKIVYYQGSILQEIISAKNFPDEFSS